MPAKVIDVDQMRTDKITARTTARIEARNNQGKTAGADETKSASVKVKATKRKAPAKKAASAKKKQGQKGLVY